MIVLEVKDNLHRILAPRLVVALGTTDIRRRRNIIPINNITPVSVDPGMIVVAVYKPWQTAENLRTTTGFTISVPHREQLELIWKMGGKFSGYHSDKEKVEEFNEHLDLGFSSYGPVLKDALGWLECEVVNLPSDGGADHLIVLAKYTKAMINPAYYSEEISPQNNPKPFMQWERNNFAEASDVFSVDYYESPRP